MSDEDAFMCLVREDSRGELSPLEYGIHPLRGVENRRGKSGGGLQGYAALVGKTAQYISQLRRSAEVAVAVDNEPSQL
jgi:hypothetical protein